MINEAIEYFYWSYHADERIQPQSLAEIPNPCRPAPSPAVIKTRPSLHNR